MRLSFAAALAFAATAFAQIPQDPDFDSIYAPDKNEKVPAGSTYAIKWNLGSKADGKVTISVLGGDDPSTLVVKDTIATGVDNTAKKYNWKIDAGLGKDKTYGILIQLEDDQTVAAYSPPFVITGYGHTASGSSSASASGSSSSSSSSDSSSSDSSSSQSSDSSASASASKTTAHSSKSKSSSSANSATPAPSSSASSTTLEVATSSSPAASGASATTSASTSASTGAAATAGSFAAVGGVVAALLAL